MLDREKSIDAVTVSTPDHTHAIAMMTAIQMGKHVFCQKPLTHTIHEARKITEAACKYKQEFCKMDIRLILFKEIAFLIPLKIRLNSCPLVAEGGRFMKREASRRQFLKYTTAGAALTSLLGASCLHTGGNTKRTNVGRVESKQTIKRPNILWIVGENLKLDLGCYGAKNVRTPNLDALAAGGMRYTHTFSTSPVCAPSRSAFFVGMYQTTSDS